ncbi:MAG: hypothetical protein JRC89_04025 [Deltaproteobacteria bacterium]|nr:hypothetical protein [Deltaproteobacteria bacterium]
MKDTGNINKFAICSSCQCRYQVPESFLGRNVSCKKCGSSFRIDFQDENDKKEAGQVGLHEQEEVEKISQDDSYLVIGKLAVKYKFVSVEKVKEALSIKEEEKQAGSLSVQKMIETKRLDSRFGTIAVKNRRV